MTPTEAIDAVAAQIISLTEDETAHTADVFRRVKTTQDVIAGKDRQFVILPSVIPRRRDDRLFGKDRSLQMDILMFYASSRNVVDRMVEDGELISDILGDLVNDVVGITDVEQFDSSVDYDDAAVIVDFDVRISYSTAL